MALILVIDDDRIVCELIVKTLDAQGFRAVSATSGEMGLRLAQQLKPDLVLCDVVMPTIDGYEVLEKLQQDPETIAIPFIFLTALDSSQDMRKGMNFGADDYLTKPISQEILIKAVKSRLIRYGKYKEVN
ncbi:response regulator receiver protein [Thalassoporum mexicanum PCC 7367]|uniref:response regulator n=1 Tax=Thalassoporum mexicanum TaxID=3457544 RepID=UPI00029FEB69|nr:response regulator [Pseudanabaena sp. PCC 7367]AFY69849.1 response regulator receiver protein [Pseudanabaena sp. PCC 7367]